MINSRRHILVNEAESIQEARVQRAAECRPGRKPGVTFPINDESPARGERWTSQPRDKALNFCRPLRGLANLLAVAIPGLTPGATLCRRLRRLVERLIPTSRATRAIVFFAFCLLPFAFALVAHTQSPTPAHGVVRLKVKYKAGSASKDLGRKRFFLIRGSLDENRNLIDRIKQTTSPSRECYYRGKGASEALIHWLRDNDCESAYCREVEEKYLSGAEAVPEFQSALEIGMRELRNRDLARRWLTNYLPPAIRSGFYDEKQKLVQALTSEAETSTKTRVMSVMTDRKGTAYLTDIEPGTYTISNLIASETQKTSILWICEREVKATDLGTAMKRPFTLSNEKDPKVKCEFIEKPLPVCGK